MSGVSSAAWSYNERFEVMRLLGGGGMGIVYEALDRQRHGRVALKTLLEDSAFAIAQFKSEFRSLADLCHPNLVSLYELFDDGSRWFFTMEYVPGRDFIEFVRLAGSCGQQASSDETLPVGATPSIAVEVANHFEAAPSCDEERVRDALRQIVEGLMVLHEAGKLHCDIKPSNVLVTDEGRVVLLDFGLVRPLGPSRFSNSFPWVAGTLAYMSPEQTQGLQLDEASDWYAVGVMLYQAINGRLPFTGTRDELLRRKLEGPPALSRESDPPALYSLQRLAADLLSPAPESRPKGGEILSRILRQEAPMPAAAVRRIPFVGREIELQAMREAKAALERREAGVIFVSGQPGTGKTALLHQFVEACRADPSYLIFSGRCREQESIPFKALDSLVDGLARSLHSLPPEETLGYIPRDADALCRIFTALRTVPTFEQSRGRAAPTDDQQRLRERAFGAFRETLSRIGDRYRLILVIDDVQWADIDSAGLLTEFLIPPDPPAVLLICAHRVEPAGRSAFLQNFDRPEVLKGVHCWNIEIGPLSQSESIELAALALEKRARPLAEVLAAESRGNVYFLLELASRATEPGRENLQATSLEGLLHDKVNRLTGNAQRLMRAVAICGKPVRQDQIFQAAEVDGSDLTAVSLLRSRNLVTITGLCGSDLIDSYHDRVRETVLAGMEEAARRSLHWRLAQVLEKSSETDPEMLAVHFEAGGDREAGGRYYSVAGRKAASATAFEHAARLFSRALASIPEESGEAQGLRVELADALANAGRSAEAARVYKDAAGHAEGQEEMDLLRKSGYHFAISGHSDASRTEFRRVLGQVGVYFPETLGGILAGVLLARAAIRLRSLRCQLRDESQVPARLLAQLDASQAALAGFGLIDLARAVYFSSVSLWLALKAGEARRLIYSLAMEASALAATGRRSERQGEKLLLVCHDLVERFPSRWSQGILALGEGFLAFATAQWIRASGSLQRAEQFLSEECPGVTWEMASLRYLQTLLQVNLGQFEEAGRCLPALLRQAEERGDLYLLNSLRGYVVPVIHLVADQPDVAARVVQEVENWLNDKVRLQHVIAFMSGVLTQIYQGQYREVWTYTQKRWIHLGATVRLSGANAYGYCLFMRIQAALACASVSDSPSALLRQAEGDCRTLARLHPRFTRAMLTASRAGIASLRGKSDAAALFAKAAEEYSKIAMFTMAAGCRFRQGVLTPGPEGQRLIEEAEDTLAKAGVKQPRAFAIAIVAASPMQPF